MNLTSEIRNLLQSFDPPDVTQRSYRKRMIELAGGGADPTARSHFDPGHFTASAFVADPNRSGVLLIHHAKIGRWLQPGGHIEPFDETLEAAVRREVSEETGLHELDSLGLLDIDIHQFPAREHDPAHLHFDLRLAFVSGSGILTSGDGTIDARWVPFGAVSKWNPELSITRPAVALRALIQG